MGWLRQLLEQPLRCAALLFLNKNKQVPRPSPWPILEYIWSKAVLDWQLSALQLIGPLVLHLRLCITKKKKDNKKKTLDPNSLKVCVRKEHVRPPTGSIWKCLHVVLSLQIPISDIYLLRSEHRYIFREEASCLELYSAHTPTKHS